jgi:bifunctional non-homologous end joining protein LigD
MLGNDIGIGSIRFSALLNFSPLFASFSIHPMLLLAMGKTSIQIANRQVPVSNLDKVMYPANQFTKSQVIEYYVNVGPFILPHLKNRPVTLVRYPDGVFGKYFYEKDAPKFTPEWIETFPVPRSEGGFIDYVLINDLPTLAWTANLAALELHPFLHRAPRIDVPTLIVFDLDPGEGANILTCAEVAFIVRMTLEKLGLKCLPKVSGSKGLQIYVPLNKRTSYDATNTFARTLAELLAREYPNLVVSQMSKSLRRGKVFIDWSQNTQSKTTVGVYSLRAKQERPLVSMPVTWEELEQASGKSDIKQLQFEPQPALQRLAKVGDLFEPVLTMKQTVPRAFLGKTVPATKPLAAEGRKRKSLRSPDAPTITNRRIQGSKRRFVVQSQKE